jgi:hypothetical protein
VGFAAITICVASQRVFIVGFISLSSRSGNFWLHACMITNPKDREALGTGESSFNSFIVRIYKTSCYPTASLHSVITQKTIS